MGHQDQDVEKVLNIKRPLSNVWLLRYKQNKTKSKVFSLKRLYKFCIKKKFQKTFQVRKKFCVTKKFSKKKLALKNFGLKKSFV